MAAVCPLDVARRRVKQYTGARDAEMIEKIAERIVQTGECVWHAAAQVSGKPCRCNDCAEVV